jgi:hypothetical protein
LTTPKTKPSTPEVDLVPGARYAIAPKGIVSTSWPRVKKTCANIGWRFDPWQDAVGRLILAKAEGGKWAADLSILSIPRQVGKSYLLGCIIFALCLLNPKLRVIWTSHHTATTEEMYEAMKELAQHKRVAPHIVKCIALQGSRWRIQFRNGSRIDFGARSQGFGRGKAKVGVLVLDEFQHITGRALANLAPTTNTSDNPLILCAGTPPGPEVSGEAFGLRRMAALGGMSEDTLYVEFSAEQDADSNDRKQWAKANPSFPKRTQERAFLLGRKMLDEADFRREYLGIWDELRKNFAFGAGAWEACALKADPGPHVDAIALAVSMDRLWASIGAAGNYDERLLVAAVDRREGTGWLVPEAWRIHQQYNVPVVVARSAADLIPALEAVGFTVRSATNPNGSLIVARAGDSQDACAQVFDRVQQGILAHANHDELDKAVYGAHRRTITGERWAWDRKNSVTDVSMLEAVTLAAWQASTAAPDYDVMASAY